MKFLFDLFPVALFFATYKIARLWDGSLPLASRWLGPDITAAQAPILLATAVTIAATVTQIALLRLKKQKIGYMMWISLVLILVFGGATLFFHNPVFIKWKPTILYWLFGTVLFVSAVFFRRNLIRTMMADAGIVLPETIWSRLNLAWVCFFAVMGLMNLYVAYRFSEETWVDFKMFGGMGLMLAFALGQGFFLSKYLEKEPHDA